MVDEAIRVVDAVVAVASTSVQKETIHLGLLEQNPPISMVGQTRSVFASI